MQVTRLGSKVRLTKGVSAEEKSSRIAAVRAAIEEEARNRPKPDISLDGAQKAYNDASTLHKVGDRVWVGNSPLIVTGEYKLRRVRNETGEFLDQAQGVRVDYKYGYSCQYRNGDEFFWPAHELTDEDGSPTHLRLVAGRSTTATRPMMEFRERERQ